MAKGNVETWSHTSVWHIKASKLGDCWRTLPSLNTEVNSQSQGQMDSESQNLVFGALVMYWFTGFDLGGLSQLTAERFVAGLGLRLPFRHQVNRVVRISRTPRRRRCQRLTLTSASSCRLSTWPVSTPSPTRSCSGRCGRRSPLCWRWPTPSARKYHKGQSRCLLMTP